MMKIIIEIDSSLREDQNQPKYHLIWTTRGWFLKLCSHSFILDQLGPMHMYNWTSQLQHQVDPHVILQIEETSSSFGNLSGHIIFSSIVLVRIGPIERIHTRLRNYMIKSHTHLGFLFLSHTHIIEYF